MTILWEGRFTFQDGDYWLQVYSYVPGDEGSFYEPPTDPEIEYLLFEDGSCVNEALEDLDDWDETLLNNAVIDFYEKEVAEDEACYAGESKSLWG